MLQSELQKHLKHNFIMSIADAAFFGLAALGLASTVTIIPLFLNTLGASSILIGLVGSIHTIGWQLPQLFTANYVAGLRRFKPMVMWMTLHERWPFFGLAVIALLMYQMHHHLAIALTMLMMMIFALGGGLTATAWQSMIGKIMPEAQRGAFFGTQSALASLLGAGGALIAGVLLERLPSPLDFTLGFFLSGLAMMVSMWFLGQTREPAHELPEKAARRRVGWKEMRAILEQDHNFRWFLAVRMLTSVAVVAVSFFTIYVVRRFGVSETTIGVLTGVMTIAQTVANPIFGWMGDRWGHRSVYATGAVMISISAGLALFAPDHTWFYLVFGLAGAAGATFWSTAIAFTLEFGETHEKPIYIGLANTLVAPASLLAPIIGGALVQAFGFQATFLLSAVAGLLTAFVLKFAVYDPRFSLKSKRSLQVAAAKG
jgi:MFS family permease